MDRALPILMVEDDVVDVRNMQRAFAAQGLPHSLFVVTDGEQALSFLNHTGRFEDPSRAPRPALILLDLNLPVMGGIEFLRVLKCDPRLRSIPVIVLSSSNQDSDVAVAYDLSVAGYFTKPPHPRKLTDTIAIIESYWSQCELPQG
jgi:CheY-like chemotaxis protein